MDPDVDLGLPDDLPDDFFDGDVNPDSIVGCAYWRCGELFERRSVNHQFCRKACRSRQKKWESAQARRERKQAKKAARQQTQTES